MTIYDYFAIGVLIVLMLWGAARAMPLWDTVMIALVIGSTIAFCFWARVRATRGDG